MAGIGNPWAAFNQPDQTVPPPAGYYDPNAPLPSFSGDPNFAPVSPTPGAPPPFGGGWQPVAYAPPTTTTDPGSGGGGGGGFSGSLGPWGGTFNAPTPQPLPNVPTFTPPSYTPPPAFSYKDFTAPTVAEALNDPGYQFRTQQGTNALQNWAAARGTLNDSGTAKALQDYGQNAASQEYQNVYNRDANTYGMNRAGAVQTYNTNYQTQYTDPYTYSYQAAKDAFAPLMTQYQTQSANIENQNNLANQNAYGSYALNWQDYQNRRALATGVLTQQ